MYDVKVYDATTEANRQLSPHFQVYEFACKDGSRPVFISQTLVDILENIRVHFGAPLHINSAYRTVAYNAKQKGSSPKSQHCNGLAADIWVEGHTPAEVYAYAERSTPTPKPCWVTTAAWGFTTRSFTSTSGRTRAAGTTAQHKRGRAHRWTASLQPF